MKEHMPEEVTFGRNADFPKRAYVWREEDEADSIFFLRSGQIAIKITDAKGHEVIVRVIGKGEPFGELCLCSARRAANSACAVIPSGAVEVSVNDFIDFLQQQHEALKNLLFMFCIRLADAERRIEVLAYRGAEERLGRLLLTPASSQSKKEGDDGDATEITLPVSHEELAQMAAMSRAHTTVTMGKFRQRGVVRYKRGQPVIVDVQALAKYLNQRERGG
jgi:CRP-like cAMP-binding protein